MTLRDAWLGFRNRLLTSESFHRACERTVFTRPIVRKRQSELFDIVSGFVYSQILLACVELDVLNIARSGVTVDALSNAIGLAEDETRRLAEGAVSLRLLEASGDRFFLGDLGAALLATPGAIAMIRHHPALYQDLIDPVAFLKSGRGETHLSRFWDYGASADADDENSAIYSELMATSQAMIAREILAAYDFSKHNVLLDMGGGHAAFVIAAARAHPSLKLQIFDLPSVARRAESILAEAGLSERSDVFSGSFFDAPPPPGADVITLVRILHDHDDAPSAAILAAAYDALPQGGTLLVCEPMLTGGSAKRISAAYFNFYLYAMGQGKPRSAQTIQGMMSTAGFVSTRQVPTRFPLMASIVSGRKR